jgi:hypothetical protein
MKKHLTQLSVAASSAMTAFLLAAQPVLAAIEPIRNNAVAPNLSNYQEAKSGASFAYYLVFIWRALIFIGGFMVILYFITGAFEWISANGEAGKISSARNKMTGAITGFIVLAATFVILEFLGNLFGFNVLTPSIPTPSGAP